MYFCMFVLCVVYLTESVIDVWLLLSMRVVVNIITIVYIS